jgi:hypothetical protein
MSIQSLCDKLVTPYPRVRSEGGAGSASFTYPTAGTPFRVRIQPASSYERMIALQRDTEISHIMYSPTDPNVVRETRIVYNSRNFDVQATPTNTDEQDRLWKLEVLETGQEQ